MSRFSGELFCLTGPKNYVREPFCVSEKFWYRESFMNRRRVGYYVFPSRVFASHSIKNFPRGTLVFQKSYGVEFFLDNRSITILSTFFSHTAENFRRGAFLSFTKWCPKFLWTKGGRENHIFLLKTFGLSAKKNRMGTL